MGKRITIIFGLLVFLSGISFAQEKKLTEKEARALIEEYHAREEAANAKIAELQPKVDSLKPIVAKLDSIIAELEAQLAECRKKPKYYGKYSVKAGDWLSKIASYRTIYHDGTKWNVIYEANKDLIENPNLIYPGWVLLIPGLDVYKVIPGDCLWRIASYISVYGNARKWAEIYEANKDKIKDRDLIYPGQEFTIPR